MPSAQPNRMPRAVKTSGSRPGAYISVALVLESMRSSQRPMTSPRPEMT